MVPFISLTCEKTAYDTFQAFRGHDIYTRGVAAGARGGFPSGGCELPSFALIPVQSWRLKEANNTEESDDRDSDSDSNNSDSVRASVRGSGSGCDVVIEK